MRLKKIMDKEVEPFVDNKISLELWSKEFFKAASEKIKFV